MNITLIRLLMNGKLGYLRRAWIKRYDVDPLKDYFLWLSKVWMVSLGMMAIGIFACIGIFSTAAKLEPYLPTAAKNMDGPVMLVCIASVMTGLLLITNESLKSVRKQWWRSIDFKDEVDSVAKSFIQADTTDEYEAVYLRRFEFLIGSPSERSGKSAQEVPLSVKQKLMGLFIDQAKEIIRKEKNPTDNFDKEPFIGMEKQNLKAVCIYAFRLGLLGIAHPQRFYAEASRQLAAEQKPELVER